MAGIDGMTINDLGGCLVKNRDKIVQGIRERKYEPQPVLRVEIPKPDGGTRTYGGWQSDTASDIISSSSNFW